MMHVDIAHDRIPALVREMEHGLAVVAVYRDMNDAGHAFDAARRWCGEQGVRHAASRSNGRMRISNSAGGSIRFTSERAELRGAACDVFSIDPSATWRDWMAPLYQMAGQRFGRLT